VGYNKKQGVRGYGISRGIQQETGGMGLWYFTWDTTRNRGLGVMVFHVGYNNDIYMYI
jgi:hypothetical protein